MLYTCVRKSIHGNIFIQICMLFIMRLLASSVYFSEYEFSSFYCGAIFFTYCIQRSNTFTADLRVSVTGAALRDNSIKVMPDMAKGER